MSTENYGQLMKQSKKADPACIKQIPSRSPQLIPVIRRKRAEWNIPRLDEQQRHLAQEEKVQRSKEHFKGTTPEGREIHRKIVLGIAERVERGLTSEEIIAYVFDFIKAVPSLHSELKHIFLLEWGAKVEPDSVTLEGAARVKALTEIARVRLFPESLSRWRF